MNKISGIYKIESKVHPDHVYIGSAIHIYKRWANHISKFKKKQQNLKLQNHYDKYGKDDLVFSIVAICDKSDLVPTNGVIWLEQFFIDSYKPWFNCCPIAGSCLGVKMSKATKDKIGKGNKGKVIPEYVREKLRKPRPEQAEKMKGNQLWVGRHHSPETLLKMKTSNLKSAATRKKLSISHSGAKNYNFGKHFSEETRKKMSISIRKALEKRKLEKQNKVA